ncbi:MAG: hypothetical protein WBE92_11595, partial [Steroidobacteraceae bacterium]
VAGRHTHAADREAAIRSEMRATWVELARRHGIAPPERRVDEILGKDLDLNAQGLVAWLDRTAAKP